MKKIPIKYMTTVILGGKGKGMTAFFRIREGKKDD